MHGLQQLRLALTVALEGKFGQLLCMLGVCCSSWVAISRGSSHRSFINPQGYTGYRAVNVANRMAARTGFAKSLTCVCALKLMFPNHVCLLLQDGPIVIVDRSCLWDMADRAAGFLSAF